MTEHDFQLLSEASDAFGIPTAIDEGFLDQDFDDIDLENAAKKAKDGINNLKVSLDLEEINRIREDD